MFTFSHSPFFLTWTCCWECCCKWQSWFWTKLRDVWGCSTALRRNVLPIPMKRHSVSLLSTLCSHSWWYTKDHLSYFFAVLLFDLPLHDANSCAVPTAHGPWQASSLLRLRESDVQLLVLEYGHRRTSASAIQCFATADL